MNSDSQRISVFLIAIVVCAPKCFVYVVQLFTSCRLSNSLSPMIFRCIHNKRKQFDLRVSLVRMYELLLLFYFLFYFTPLSSCAQYWALTHILNAHIALVVPSFVGSNDFGRKIFLFTSFWFCLVWNLSSFLILEHFYQFLFQFFDHEISLFAVRFNSCYLPTVRAWLRLIASLRFHLGPSIFYTISLWTRLPLLLIPLLRL